MGDRLPVDTTGIKLALLVGGGVLLFIFAGQVLRFMSRVVTWGSFVLLAALAMYVVYEVYTGWTAEEEPGRNFDAEREDPVVTTEYSEGSLSEAELESELDQLLDDQRNRERRDVERDTEL